MGLQSTKTVYKCIAIVKRLKMACDRFGHVLSGDNHYLLLIKMGQYLSSMLV